MENGIAARRISWLLPSFGLIASVSIFSVTLGLTYPLLSLRLNELGVSESVIGSNAAMTPLGMVLSAPLIPYLMRFVSPVAILISCASACIILLFLVGATDDVALWFPLRFLLGCATNGLFVISETGIIKVAPPAVRGRILGAYTTTITLGYALGPLVLAISGHEGWLAFGIAIAFVTAALLIIAAFRSSLHESQAHEHDGESLLSFIPKAPLILLACASVAIFDNANMSFMPLYAIDHGLSEQLGSKMLSALLVGGIIMQYPIGYFSDRVSNFSVLILCSALVVAGCFLIEFLIGTPIFLFPFLVFWGGLAFGVYTLALIELGARFEGSTLVTGNAALAMTWGIGSMFGVPTAGVAMSVTGSIGLLVMIGTPFALLLAFALTSRMTWQN